MLNKFNKLPEIHSIWLDEDEDIEKLYGLQNQQCLSSNAIKNGTLNNSVNSLNEIEKMNSEKLQKQDKTVFDNDRATKYNIKVVNSDEPLLSNRNSIVLRNTVAGSEKMPEQMKKASKLKRSLSLKKINIFRTASFSNRNSEKNSQDENILSKEAKAQRRISSPYGFKHISHANVDSIYAIETNSKETKSNPVNSNNLLGKPNKTPVRNIETPTSRFSCAFVTESIPDYQVRLARDDSFYNERPQSIKNIESVRLKRSSTLDPGSVINRNKSPQGLPSFKQQMSPNAISRSASLSRASDYQLLEPYSAQADVKKSLSVPPKVVPFSSPNRSRFAFASNTEYPTIMEDHLTDFEGSSISTKDTNESLKTPTITNKFIYMSPYELTDPHNKFQSPSYESTPEFSNSYRPMYL